MSNQKLIAHVNRKNWWHVPPQDPNAYCKRGRFLASSFKEAEFWGRPLDEPQRVTVAHLLVGDEDIIERKLFGTRVSTDDISVQKRWALDAKMKKAALANGFDAIVLMTPKAYSEFKVNGKLPRSMELNTLNTGENGGNAGMKAKRKDVLVRPTRRPRSSISPKRCLHRRREGARLPGDP